MTGRGSRRLPLLLLLAGTAQAVGAAPVAVLEKARGAVMVRARGAAAYIRVSGRRELGEGDVIVVKAGGAALYVQGPARERLAPGAIRLVGRDRPWPVPSGRNLPDRHRQSFLEVLGPAARTVPGAVNGVRSEKDPSFGALYPPAPGLLDGTPILPWTPLKEARKYEVVVEDERGETVTRKDANGLEVWPQTVRTGTELRFPTGHAPLPPGLYHWRVTAFDPNGDTEVGEGSFTVPPAAEARAIRAALADARREKSGPEPALPLAVVSLRYQLYAEAEPLLRQALSHRPGDASLHLLLAHVLFATGRPIAGRAEYERAIPRQQGAPRPRGER